MPKSLDDVYRRIQDQALLIERSSLELKAHLLENGPFMEQFYEFVTHPENGVVARLRRLERDVAALEKWRAKKAETKEWTWRNIVLVGLMLVASSIMSGWLAVRIFGA